MHEEVGAIWETSGCEGSDGAGTGHSGNDFGVEHDSEVRLVMMKMKGSHHFQHHLLVKVR